MSGESKSGNNNTLDSAFVTETRGSNISFLVVRSRDLPSCAGRQSSTHEFEACACVACACVYVRPSSCPPGAWPTDQSALSPRPRGARPSFQAPMYPTLALPDSLPLPRRGRLTCALRSRPGENLSAFLYTLGEKNRSTLVERNERKIWDSA